jgi:hypothetical protein
MLSLICSVKTKSEPKASASRDAPEPQPVDAIVLFINVSHPKEVGIVSDFSNVLSGAESGA